MRKFFEWYSRLAPWYQAALLSLYFGIWLSAFTGLAIGKLGAGLAGLLIGLIMGLAYYYREQRDKTGFWITRTHETIDDYPEELEEVERRYSKQCLILAPTFLATGIAVSWIILGSGTYGVLGAGLAIVVAAWALGRFGGPNDPKWKRVRD